MYSFNRDLAAFGIDWAPKRLYYLEAWIYPEATSITHWNFRNGFLEESQLDDWLHHRYDSNPPSPPPGIGSASGGIRLLACDYTLFQRATVGMSREAFGLIESSFHLHPATLQSLEVPSGTFSRHFDRDRLSMILKAPQKYETGNSTISIAHDASSGWTTALLAGESIVDAAMLAHASSPLPVPMSPCAVIRHYLGSSIGLWHHPLTLPCIILTHHLRRLQEFVTKDLTPRVMAIEEQLGVTRVGRRKSGPLSRMYGGTNSLGRPVERHQAEALTVHINTELTRVQFTARNPTWNHEASAFLIKTLTELTGAQSELSAGDSEVLSLLDHNVTLAKSLESSTFGLQKRLELQLNVLYSFVAQTDNRLSARLAATAGRDSTSMKILAFITTIFLPGTFIATLFSMNMFSWDDGSPESNGSTISPQFWIYWAVAAPLTALTLGGWGLWWSFEKHRYDEHFDESTTNPGKGNSTPWWQGLLPLRMSSHPARAKFQERHS